AVERAKPLLGTVVRVRARHRSPAAAMVAIDAAFAAVAKVHALMSFHQAGSDVSRINCSRGRAPVVVDPQTLAVVSFALRMAEASGGAFDPTVGARAVEAGALPRPAREADPDSAATWRDVTIEGEAVQLRRPLWLDLCGLAKGYAVDRAVAALTECGAAAGCVDAGGDLRVFGRDAARISLRAVGSPSAPLLELADAAVASSGGDPRVSTRHFDPPRGARVEPEAFASVVAAECMTADALTKVVLALGLEGACACLEAFDATAYAHHPAGGWLASAAT
ncbi:MAG TPA: FAD:protein FMN transferase, partial [Caulobacteraceae bacterium]|nr:FAD:protein FMN transferase [Caulobacteraceae bacterium]